MDLVKMQISRNYSYVWYRYVKIFLTIQHLNSQHVSSAVNMKCINVHVKIRHVTVIHVLHV